MAASPGAKIVPGAGTYSPGKKLSQQDAPKWQFGTGNRGEMAMRTATKDIGPG